MRDNLPSTDWVISTDPLMLLFALPAALHRRPLATQLEHGTWRSHFNFLALHDAQDTGSCRGLDRLSTRCARADMVNWVHVQHLVRGESGKSGTSEI